MTATIKVDNETKIRFDKLKARQLKEFQEAKEVFMKCLENNEDQDSAWFNLACLSAIQGDIHSTIDQLKQAFDLNPSIVSEIGETPYFNPVRNDPEFQALIRERKKNR